MRAADWEESGKAAGKEIEMLVPANKKVLNSTWVFRRKGFPDGKLRKHKARFCVRGDQQVARIDYFETYAPVTSWTMVRLLLTLSIVANLESIQVDYTNVLPKLNYQREKKHSLNFPKDFMVQIQTKTQYLS
jgi:hypothetical protein